MRKFLLALGLAAASSSAYADYSCDVDVSRVLIYRDGSVNVLHSGRGDYTYVCNLQMPWKGVDTITCAMWTSFLQSSQNNNKNAVFYYSGEGSCAALPIYGEAPSPVYVGVVD